MGALPALLEMELAAQADIAITHMEATEMGLFDSALGGRGGMSPAAIALLGLLAVKGFENRDKIAGAIQGALGGSAPQGNNSSVEAGSVSSSGGIGGLLGGLGGLLGGNASSGSVISGGLGDLLNGFQQAGHGDVANSWVKDGPNRAPAPQQVEQAVGPDVIDQLAKATGLSRDELLQRLTHELPKAVDGLTPDGRVPTPQEAAASATQA